MIFVLFPKQRDRAWGSYQLSRAMRLQPLDPLWSNSWPHSRSWPRGPKGKNVRKIDFRILSRWPRGGAKASQREKHKEFDFRILSRWPRCGAKASQREKHDTGDRTPNSMFFCSSLVCISFCLAVFALAVCSICFIDKNSQDKNSKDKNSQDKHSQDKDSQNRKSQNGNSQNKNAAVWGPIAGIISVN